MPPTTDRPGTAAYPMRSIKKKLRQSRQTGTTTAHSATTLLAELKYLVKLKNTCQPARYMSTRFKQSAACQKRPGMFIPPVILDISPESST
jgi:hypothetical protein